MAEQPQSLEAIPLIRRKRGGEGESQEAPAGAEPHDPIVSVEPTLVTAPDNALRMKPREIVQLAAVHVRIPEQIARGLRLMSVLESRQTQELAAEAFETMLNSWNPNWRKSVPVRE